MNDITDFTKCDKCEKKATIFIKNYNQPKHWFCEEHYEKSQKKRAVRLPSPV